MSPRTSGTWTILFTDLVGSTELRARLGDDDADQLRAAHDHLLGEAVAAQGGDVVKGLGDGIMAAFSGAADAVTCAVAMQQAIDRHNRSTAEPIDVRIGISLGDARAEEDDLFGTPVVEAARLCGRAGGGQILCSDLVRAVAGSRAAHGFNSLGEFELKGLPEPLAVSEVLWEPLPVEGPASPFPLPGGLGVASDRFAFVGREEELDSLRTAAKLAAEGDRATLLLAGEPGIGKTRLAYEVAQSRHCDGGTVLYGRCDDEVGVPYQPFVEALEHFITHCPPEDASRRMGRYPGELVRLVPWLADHMPDLPPPLESDPETERYRLFEAVAGWLVATSETEPTILILDDLHWAAKPTLLLFRHIAQSQDAARLLIIATYRDTDLERTSALPEVLGDLRRTAGVERVALRGLDETGVVEFLEHSAGHTMDAAGLALATAIHHETEGNPFFIGEVLRHLRDTGAIYEQDGRWTTHLQVNELGIPEGVREVIGRRLTRLSDEANQTLTLAAVVGRGFELEVVENVSDLDEELLLTALDEAVDARLVHETGIGRYRFAHALVRSTLYDEVRPTRRARLHQRVGSAIETVHAGALDDHLGELAHHYSRSGAGGDAVKAIEFARRAGERALAQLAHDDAVLFYEQAAELLDGDEAEDRATMGEVLLGLGIARRRAGDPRYRDTLLEAAHLAEEIGDAGLQCRAALANNRGFFSATGAVDRDRIAVLERALGQIGPDDSATRARLLANLALEEIFAGDLSDRLARTDEALAVARRVGDPATLAHVLTTRSASIWDPSTLDERLSNTAEVVELAEQLGDPSALFFATWYRMATCLEAGRVDDYERALADVNQWAGELGQSTPIWMASFTTAGDHFLRARLDQAEACALESLELGQGASEPDAVFFFGVLLWVIRREQGRLSEIRDLVRTAIEENPGIAGIAAMLADTCIQLGEHDEARALLEPLSASGFGDRPRDQIWSSFMWVCAETAAGLDDARWSAALAELLLPYEHQLVYNGLVPFGAMGATLGRLALARGELDDAERFFGRSLETEEQMRAPVLESRSRLGLARVAIARAAEGDAERARELLDRVLEVAREHGLTALEAEALATKAGA